MGNPLNLKINTEYSNNGYINTSPTKDHIKFSNSLRNYQSTRGKIPKNHIDIGPGVCPNDLEHHVHIIMNDVNIPMFYKCSECRYQQSIIRRKN